MAVPEIDEPLGHRVVTVYEPLGQSGRLGATRSCLGEVGDHGRQVADAW